MFMRLLAAWKERNRAFSCKFHASLPLIGHGWIAASVALAGSALLNVRGEPMPFGVVALFAALIAPVFALRATLDYFRGDALRAQPAMRLARFGRWRELNPVDCRTEAGYGTGGIMAILLAGLLLNIPVRAVEFVTAMPLPRVGMPDWHGLLYSLMLADLVLLSTCYAVLVGLAVRRVPMFPRLLVMVWALDVLFQANIATVSILYLDVPKPVADALSGLVQGNIQKVLISAIVWTPYLLLSRRVNLTFRRRVRLSATTQ